MAEANFLTEVVKVPVTTYKDEVKETGVQLNLSMAEARVLSLLVGSISGSSFKSIRKYTDQIWAALPDRLRSGTIRRLSPGFYAPEWDGVDPFEEP